VLAFQLLIEKNWKDRFLTKISPTFFRTFFDLS
jgi:hypothetical protein